MTSPKCDDEDPACQDVSASTRLVLFFSRFVLFDLSAWRETFSAAPAAICFGAPDLSAFATGQSRFLIVPNLGVSALQTAWAASCLGMEFALNFMKNNAGIDSPALLSSPFILIALAYHGHKRDYVLSVDESRLLRYWVLVANAKGRYSRGSSEIILDQDLAMLRDGGGAQELIDRLRQQVGRLDVAADELEGRNQRSSLFKTMFLAYRAAGAKDWRSQVAIA